MEREATIWAALVLVGAGWLVLHAALLIRTARAPGVSRPWRLLAWLPPMTPIVAWRAGARVRAVAWVVSMTLYFVLRSMV